MQDQTAQSLNIWVISVGSKNAIPITRENKRAIGCKRRMKQRNPLHACSPLRHGNLCCQISIHLGTRISHSHISLGRPHRRLRLEMSYFRIHVVDKLFILDHSNALRQIPFF